MRLKRATRATPLAVLAVSSLSVGCGSASSGHARISEKTSAQHRAVVVDTASLIARYVRVRETTGQWPAPGTWDTDVLVYKGTESGPDRRRDFYRTTFAHGRELDLLLYDDGRIEVNVLEDIEPPRAGEF